MNRLRTGLLMCVLGVFVQPARSEFPTPTNSEREVPSPLLTPAKALANLQLPSGFRATVFAAEPDVQNPIDMAWDARGRLWVAENYTYAERRQRFDLSLKDRVVILHDTDGDGISDQRKVFLDDVQMLTSVEVGHGGVWLMCPPFVLFVPDQDRDDVPDGPAQIVLDGFTVAQVNYHNFANGLRWGPDGWLYGRCGGSCPGRIGVPGTPDRERVAIEGGMFRYHPVRKQVEVLVAGTANPWGHDWNEMGDGFFVNTVNGHLWHLIPGAHFMRPFTLDPNRTTYELIDFHADHWHFDTGQSWTASRDGAANSYGGGHAHEGCMIYLGGRWPAAYHGKLFTINLHGRRVNVESLERHGSGYVARHQADVFVSDDVWFRGMDLSYGPDGNVLLLDWSDVGECHENTGVHRTSGRIFKIVYGDSAVKSTPIDLTTASDGELVGLHESRNEWFVRRARIELAARRTERQIDPDAVEQLRRQLMRATEDVLRIRALLTLSAIEACDRDFLRSLLRDNREYIRAWAIRLLTENDRLDDVMGPIADGPSMTPEIEHVSKDLVQLAATETSPYVWLTLASTLQRLPLELRPALAAAIVSHAEANSDHNLPLMVWYGLMPVADEDPAALVPVVQRCQWPTTRRLIARRLAEQIGRYPDAVDELLRVASRGRDSLVADVLRGMSDGLRGVRRAKTPAEWQAFASRVRSMQSSQLSQLVRQISVVFGSGRALEELQRMALDANIDYASRIAGLNALIDIRAKQLRSTCAQLLSDARLNVVAARGLSSYDDPEVGQLMIDSYRRFRGPERPKVISILVSRPSFAHRLLDAVEEEKIDVNDLSVYDVRQLMSLGDPDLSDRAAQVWGLVRRSSQEKIELIEQQKKVFSAISLAAADLSSGRAVFNASCAKCHRLYGEGAMIGPDLTGSNRNNLHYVLENIIDPSAVVPKGFWMTVVELKDGRVLNGLVVEANDRIVTLQNQTDRMVISRQDIERISKSELSAMPDGLFDVLSPVQRRDLVAYLMHPTQVPLPQSIQDPTN